MAGPVVIVSTPTAHRCDANATGVAATDWGFKSLPCQVRSGLRSFIDREGIRRYFCGSLGHEANVKRRLGQSIYEGMDE